MSEHSKRGMSIAVEGIGGSGKTTTSRIMVRIAHCIHYAKGNDCRICDEKAQPLLIWNEVKTWMVDSNGGVK